VQAEPTVDQHQQALEEFLVEAREKWLVVQLLIPHRVGAEAQLVELAVIVEVTDPVVVVGPLGLQTLEVPAIMGNWVEKVDHF
jgi:hypothetical protein